MGALAIAASWFFILHTLPSTPLRPRAVALVGEGIYTAIFSVASAIAIWWLVHQFNGADYGDKLWIVPGWWPWLKAASILFAFILIFGGVCRQPVCARPGEDRRRRQRRRRYFRDNASPPDVGHRHMGDHAHDLPGHLARLCLFRRFRRDRFDRKLAATETQTRHGSRLGRFRSEDLVLALRGHPARPCSIQLKGRRLATHRPRRRRLGRDFAFPLLAARRAGAFFGPLAAALWKGEARKRPGLCSSELPLQSGMA